MTADNTTSPEALEQSESTDNSSSTTILSANGNRRLQHVLQDPCRLKIVLWMIRDCEHHGALKGRVVHQFTTHFRCEYNANIARSYGYWRGREEISKRNASDS